MRLSKYDIFLKAVECGSLSGAAEQLGYTQSAVSQQIAALEREMGVTLLLRGRRGIRLTEDGTACLPHIRAILEAQAALENKVFELQGIMAGKVRVGTITSVSCHVLPPVIRSFRQKYPNVSFELIQGNYRDIEGWLLDGTVDLGFLRRPASEKLDVSDLLEDEMVAVLPRDHPCAGWETFPAERLAEEPFILQEEGYNDDLQQYFEANGLMPSIAFRVSDDYTIMSFVESGIGISIQPEAVLRRAFYRVVGKPLDPPYYRRLGVACLDRQALSAAAKMFMQELLASRA